MQRLLILALVLKVSAAVAAGTSLVSPTGDVYEVEFRFRADVLADGAADDPEGIAALRPARLASGEAGFLVWGNGAWQEVRGDGIAPASNEWMQAKFVVRTFDGEKLVSYLVRSGTDYVRLQTASGQGWFRASAAALAADGGLIDGYSAYLRESAAANDARWPQARTFAQDVAVLKDFIIRHCAWLDAQFATVPTLMESIRCDAQTSPWDGTILPEPLRISIR